ncbi:MAG: helix-turn-helix transcriptional regulator [Firmicutes bacterium]|nr:helix-turn-helix transcriptional regulator [Bacillota bacterium]
MNKLKEIRIAKKMSGVDVANAINITPQYYYELEKGKKRLNEDLLRKLAVLFECTVDCILGLTHPPQPNIPPQAERAGETPAIFMNTRDGYLTVEEIENIIIRAVAKALKEKN